MSELVKKYEDFKERHAKLNQRKLKVEASVAVAREKRKELEDKIRETLGVEPSELSAFIEREQSKLAADLEEKSRLANEAEAKLSEIEARLLS